MKAQRLPYFLKPISGRRFWQSARETYEEAFRDYVDSIVEEIEAGEESVQATDSGEPA